MQGVKIKSEIELVATFKKLAQVYEEIAVIKMQRVRNSVLSTRGFLERLSFVFLDVKRSYRREIEKLLKEKKSGGRHLPISYQTNGKNVKVFLSANTKMYGDIINRVFDLLTESMSNNDFDTVIIGKLGKELFEHKFPNKKYEYFELPDSNVTLEDLKKIAALLIAYETVEVYYGKFENVVKQTPAVFKITGEEELSPDNQKEDGQKMGFFFEPSLETILTFFQDQVFSSLFRQSISEGELSRFASRITAMEEALESIEKREKKLKIYERREKKLVNNKKQIERLSSFLMWR